MRRNIHTHTHTRYMVNSKSILLKCYTKCTAKHSSNESKLRNSLNKSIRPKRYNLLPSASFRCYAELTMGIKYKVWAAQNIGATFFFDLKVQCQTIVITPTHKASYRHGGVSTGQGFLTTHIL